MWLTGILSLLLVLPDAAGALTPRISFNLDSPGRPLVHFKDSALHKTLTLLLSDNGSTLYVGALDAVLSLDVGRQDGISLKAKVEWRPSQENRTLCAIKRKSEMDDCVNFIRVLQPINSTHLYACGSFAYNPHDIYIDRENLFITLIPPKTQDIKGRCPFNPFQRNTAITVGEELFTATTSNFRGTEPVISRHLSKNGRMDIRQDSSMTSLEEPSFVSSSFDPEMGKLYFFFSEVGEEFNFLDKLQVARVAQVCKDDTGGQRTLQRHWTSFAKALLLCQPQKQLPFGVLQDMFTLQPAEGSSTKDTLFYGIFTSQWSMGVGKSAVCVFPLENLRRVFSRNYKMSDVSKQQLRSLQNDRNFKPGMCGLENATDAFLENVKKRFLTSDEVRPVDDAPLLVSRESYTRMVVVRTTAVSGKIYTVLFLLTESGYLHKTVLLDRGPWIIEEIQVFKKAQLLPTLLASPTKGVVFVGWSDGVTRVPLADCSYYTSCTRCVLSRDPFCGWDHFRATCTKVDTDWSLIQDLEKGDVSKVCPGPLSTVSVLEIETSLNEMVKLQCQKTSNLAYMSWISTGFSILPSEIFHQFPDDSLVFLVNADTLGNYSCLSIEERYQEVVVKYIVRLRPVAVSHTPYLQTKQPSDPKIPQDHNPSQAMDPNIASARITESNTIAVNEDQATSQGEEKLEELYEPCLNESLCDFSLTPGTPTREDLNEDQEDGEEKSYHKELVAVSFLLGICIFLLLIGALHKWWHRRKTFILSPQVTPEGGGAQGSLGNTPSLDPFTQVVTLVDELSETD